VKLEGSCCSEIEITNLYGDFYSGEKTKLLATAKEIMDPYYVRHEKLVAMVDFLDDLIDALFPDILTAVNGFNLKFNYLEEVRILNQELAQCTRGLLRTIAGIGCFACSVKVSDYQVYLLEGVIKMSLHEDTCTKILEDCYSYFVQKINIQEMAHNVDLVLAAYDNNLYKSIVLSPDSREIFRTRAEAVMTTYQTLDGSCKAQKDCHWLCEQILHPGGVEDIILKSLETPAWGLPGKVVWKTSDHAWDAYAAGLISGMD